MIGVLVAAGIAVLVVALACDGSDSTPPIGWFFVVLTAELVGMTIGVGLA